MSTLIGVHLSVVMSSRYVLPLQKDENLEGTVTRVNSTNVLDEGLRIGEIGRQINSKVKSVKQGVYRK
jgi:hypothetical protein